MPHYTYFCEKCEEHFDIVHSMQEVAEVCELCCVTGSIKKIPALIGETRFNAPDRKVGSLVKEHIQQSSKDLKQQKKDLRSREL